MNYRLVFFIFCITTSFCFAATLNSSVTFSVPFAPIPVPIYRNNNAIVYELKIHNKSTETITPISIDINVNRVNTFMTYKGNALHNSLEFSNGKDISPGESATLFVWMVFPAHQNVPENLTHQMVYYANGNPKDVRLTMLSDPIAIQENDVLSLSAPLEGGPWLVSGISNEATNRRFEILYQQFGPFHPERFAIDWTKYDRVGGSDHKGDGSQNRDYYAYGQTVLSGSDGEVVALCHSLQDNPHPPQEPNIDNILYRPGNFIVIETGEKYIIYSHLQPNILVTKGQIVTRGQAIGYVGSSGDAAIPHLRVTVVDANCPASPLLAEGLPYTYKNFTLLGFTNSNADFYLNPYIPTSMNPEIIRNELPLDGMFVYWT